MQRKASAVWKGGLKDGQGSLSAPGGVLNNTQYSFATRFENAAGTNPEELIAAAHAGTTVAAQALYQKAFQMGHNAPVAGPDVQLDPTERFLQVVAIVNDGVVLNSDLDAQVDAVSEQPTVFLLTVDALLVSVACVADPGQQDGPSGEVAAHICSCVRVEVLTV